MPIQLPKELEKLLNVEEEKDEKLQALANKHNAILMALIAPYVPERISPSEYLSASLGIMEEFSIETVIYHIQKNTKCRTLYLVINSPGGLVHSSYKIAKALRENFDNIVIFVPYLAASGGTLICLAGNKIVMGMMSYLTPIDPHFGSIPLNALPKAFGRLVDYFQKKDKDEAPFPWVSLTERIDPIQLESYSGEIRTVERYASEILRLSHPKLAKETIQGIAYNLTEGYESHSTLIGLKEATRIKLPVVSKDEFPTEWETLREWLGRYLLQSESRHFVRCILPKKQRKSKPKKGRKK